MKRYKFLILIPFLFFINGIGIFSANAQNSYESQKDSSYAQPMGAGLRYWIAYEYCWINNTYIPESVWKSNIDWINQNFKSYGYDMISNDGWIEGAQTINANGYITKYNSNWENNFKYWSSYISDRGMKMGIYYNPLWLTKKAFEQNVTIEGTKYKARDIVGKASFNEPLYWVDVDKPGAKEWIKGYVEYFINLGTTFLRVDFLENYERNYGTIKYEKALKWIKEAAGNKIILSLVMPNCYNHAQTELLYGDMIRIDDDCFNGGWNFVSDRKRGQWQSCWPQYGNAFDGFLGFADIGGRGQMILDGDFIRLNTLSNDTERKFQVSLFLMAGSPITIADQYNTIGNSTWIYQNTELLDLNDQGFIGKPLSYNPKDTVNSSRWIGQLPDGDWIVGLFNRESTAQIRSIDLVKDLGIVSGKTENVRDLWSHSDLGSISGVYSENLPPHDCRILKIESNKEPRYEAEVASMIGGALKNSDHLNFSGSGYVDRFDAVGAKVLFAVSVATKDVYALKVTYANSIGRTCTASIYINDSKLSEPLSMPTFTSWDMWGTVSKNLELNKGVNYISIQHDSEDIGLFNLDYIQLIKL